MEVVIAKISAQKVFLPSKNKTDVNHRHLFLFWIALLRSQ